MHSPSIRLGRESWLSPERLSYQVSGQALRGRTGSRLRHLGHYRGARPWLPFGACPQFDQPHSPFPSGGPSPRTETKKRRPARVWSAVGMGPDRPPNSSSHKGRISLARSHRRAANARPVVDDRLPAPGALSPWQPTSPSFCFLLFVLALPRGSKDNLKLLRQRSRCLVSAPLRHRSHRGD